MYCNSVNSSGDFTMTTYDFVKGIIIEHHRKGNFIYDMVDSDYELPNLEELYLIKD